MRNLLQHEPTPQHIDWNKALNRLEQVNSRLETVLVKAGNLVADFDVQSGIIQINLTNPEQNQLLYPSVSAYINQLGASFDIGGLFSFLAVEAYKRTDIQDSEQLTQLNLFVYGEANRAHLRVLEVVQKTQSTPSGDMNYRQYPLILPDLSAYLTK